MGSRSSNWFREYDLVKARERGCTKAPVAHQSRSLDALSKWYDKAPPASRGGILVLPTGAGKTFTAARFLCRYPISEGSKVLWLAHTHHLLEQAFVSFIDSVPSILEPKATLTSRVVSGTTGHFPISSIKPSDDVVVSSIQTASRALEKQHPSLLAFLKSAQKGLFVVFDEAHHSPAPSYRRFLQALREYCDDVSLLGLTATPTYSDEKKKGWLGRLFPQRIIHQEEPSKLMADRVLAKPILKEVPTSIEPEFDEREYKNWVNTFRDLPERVIQELASKISRNRLIVDHYVAGKETFGKTIIFADRWYQCDQLREMLRKRDVKADVVYSHIDADPGNAESRNRRSAGENSKVLERFKNNELDVLINVRMLTEGTDVPDVQTVFLTRQTTSQILLTQMVGRALRGSEFGGTDVAYIVSFIDEWHQHINWASYDQIADGIADDSKREFGKRPPLQVISIELVRRFARESDNGISSALDAYLSYLPIGWYRVEFDALASEVDSDDIEQVDRLILVFDGQKKAFEDFINYFVEGNNQAAFEDTSLDPKSVQSTLGKWRDHFFSDIPIGVSRIEEDLLSIARHIAQNDGARPHFFAFEDRDLHDLDRLAKQSLDEDWSRSKEDDLLEAEFARTDRLWKSLYHNESAFRSHYIGCYERLRHLRKHGISHDSSSVVFTNPESIEDREPSDDLKRNVKQRDGNRCLCCGETRRLTIDHIHAAYYGRRNDEENLQTLCFTCNLIKETQQIDFREQRTALGRPLDQFNFLDKWVPTEEDANVEEAWERYIRRCINFFYQCAAVESSGIQDRDDLSHSLRVSLVPGNPSSWLDPYVDELSERVPIVRSKDKSHDSTTFTVPDVETGDGKPVESGSFMTDLSVGTFSISTSDPPPASVRFQVFQMLASKPRTGREVSLELTGKPDRIPALLKDEQYPTPSGKEPRVSCEVQKGSRGVIYSLTTSGKLALTEGTVDSDAPPKSPPGPAPWRKNSV